MIAFHLSTILYTFLSHFILLSAAAVYEVIDWIPHDVTSFTQGFTLGPFSNKNNVVLYESTGLYGQSKVRSINVTTGEVIRSVSLESTFFGEGLVYNSVNDTLIQLTWKERTGFIYDPYTLKEIGRFSFETFQNQGWGITQNSLTKELIVSDGSSFLHFWDPLTLQELRRVQVKRLSTNVAVPSLNELEYVNGYIFANIWKSNEIIAIDPLSGLVQVTYDLSNLMSGNDYSAGVLNGISISDDKTDEIFITGKRWDKIFRIKLAESKPSLESSSDWSSSNQNDLFQLLTFDPMTRTILCITIVAILIMK